MDIVCLGDSITFGYLVLSSEAWPGIVGRQLSVTVSNCGLCGDTTGGMLARFEAAVIDRRPEVAVLLGGANDLLCHIPLSEIKRNLGVMVRRLSDEAITAVVGITPPVSAALAAQNWPFDGSFAALNRDIARLRKWEQSFAQVHNCIVFDFYSLFCIAGSQDGDAAYYLDGLHPTPEGHQMMAGLAMKILQDSGKI